MKDKMLHSLRSDRSAGGPFKAYLSKYYYYFSCPLRRYSARGKIIECTRYCCIVLAISVYSRSNNTRSMLSVTYSSRHSIGVGETGIFMGVVFYRRDQFTGCSMNCLYYINRSLLSFIVWCMPIYSYGAWMLVKMLYMTIMKISRWNLSRYSTCYWFYCPVILHRFEKCTLLSKLMFWEAVKDYGNAEDRSADRLLRMNQAWNIYNMYIADCSVYDIGETYLLLHYACQG